VPIDFHAEQNRYTYAAGEADPAWRQAISEIAAVDGKHPNNWGRDQLQRVRDLSFSSLLHLLQCRVIR
jgi:hypothetical protein